MTKKQKFIASCGNPYYNKFATKTEVKRAKTLAKGKYWLDEDYGQYCSFSPGGLRRFFAYGETNVSEENLQNNVFNYLNSLRKNKARKAAQLWSDGYCKEAKLLDDLEPN